MSVAREQPVGPQVGWVLAIGMTVAAMAVVGLVGAATDHPGLTRWVVDLPAATPLSALMLLLLAVALILRVWPARADRVGAAVAVAAVVLAGSVLFAWTTGLEHPWAQVISSPATQDPHRPGLSSTPTAAAVALIGLAIASARRFPARCQILASVGAGVGLVSLVAMAYGDRMETMAASAFPATRMALPVAVGITLAGLAVPLLTPDHGILEWLGRGGPGRGLLRRFGWLTLVVPFVVGLVFSSGTVQDYLGTDRAWAFAVVSSMGLLLLVSLSAVDRVDELSVQAARAVAAEERARASAGAAAVAELAQGLSRAASVQEIAELVRVLAPGPLGALTAHVGLADDRLRRVEVLHSDTFDEGVAERFRELGVEAATPLTDAMVFRRQVYVRDRSEFASARYAHLRGDMESAGLHAVAAVPLTGGDGRVLGALAFGFDRPLEPGGGESALLTTVAELVAGTLERARLFDAEHDLIDTLQARMFTTVPQVDHLDVEVRYQPTGRLLDLGGDWVEAIRLPDMRLAVVLGDVVGHGITAAADMTLLRSFVSALMRSGTPPEEVLSRTSDLLMDQEEIITATASVSVLDPDEDRLFYASAGHPPPVLYVPGEGISVLEGGRRPLLGLPGGAAPALMAPFPPGAVLFTFTDGMIEHGRRPIDEGIEKMVAVIAAMGDAVETTSSKETASLLLAATLGGVDPEDDVALAVVRRERM